MSRVGFDNPNWWPLAGLVGLGALWLVWRSRRDESALRAELGPRALELWHGRSSWRRRLRGALAGLAAIALAIAVLEPGGSRRSQAASATDVILVLDVSRSMLALDESPSRLGRAKRAIELLLEAPLSLRLGLVVYAGEARLHLPRTRDVQAFRRVLEEVDDSLIAKGGTDLPAALERAREALGGEVDSGARIVLLSDGEDPSGRGVETARGLAQAGLRIDTIHFGTRAGGKIALPTEGGSEFLKDSRGNDVVVVADPEPLRRLAESGGGESRDGHADIDALASLLRGENRVDAAESTGGPRFSWQNALLLLALLGMALEWIACGPGR